jgi:hypothetical protein
MIYAPGGTRRSAAFHGIKAWTQEYIEWAQAGTLSCLDLLFEHGVHHVFLPLFMSGHIREVQNVEAQLAKPASRFVAAHHILAAYQERGWRVRLVGGDFSDTLSETKNLLLAETAQTSEKTLWWTVSRGIAEEWTALAPALQTGCTDTHAAAIRAYYGLDVPLISLFLGFGKPFVSPELFPPLLQGEVQCYWSQQVGYSLTARQLRLIFYDYAFLRNTWQQDKLTRAAEAVEDRTLWESELILGLGRRMGPFWYPLFGNDSGIDD